MAGLSSNATPPTLRPGPGLGHLGLHPPRIALMAEKNADTWKWGVRPTFVTLKRAQYMPPRKYLLEYLGKRASAHHPESTGKVPRYWPCGKQGPTALPTWHSPFTVKYLAARLASNSCPNAALVTQTAEARMARRGRRQGLLETGNTRGLSGRRHRSALQSHGLWLVRRGAPRPALSNRCNALGGLAPAVRPPSRQPGPR